MTPREKNLMGLLSLALATLVALGGVWAYADSKSSAFTELKTHTTDEIKRLDGKDTDIISRLDRIERKIDTLAERRR